MQKVAAANKQYIDLIYKVLSEGEVSNTRNGKVFTVYNQMMRFTETPLISIRKTNWVGAIREMEWFLSGSIHLKDLHPSVHHWWKPWSDSKGELWGLYGQQLRKYNNIFDQVSHAIKLLNTDPKSRRNVLTTWHPQDMNNPSLALPTCHGTAITLNVDNAGFIHLMMLQRSADLMLGVPHNLIQYWALLMYLAETTNKKVGSFTWVGSNIHIYEQHKDVASEMVRTYLSDKTLAKENILIYNKKNTEFKAVDFTLLNAHKPVIVKKLPLVV